jgi:uncharacterized protein with von Willebrand factor type A (vWA) domain
MAAMDRLLASMSPEQRAELQALSEQLMANMDLAFEVDRLGANLRGQFPQLGWGQATEGIGGGQAGDGEPASLSATVDAMERIHDYEALEETLRGDYPGADIADVDEEQVRRVLGEESVRADGVETPECAEERGERRRV